MKSLIGDVIEELKRLQVEYGNIEVVKTRNEFPQSAKDFEPIPACPQYNQKERRVEF